MTQFVFLKMFRPLSRSTRKRGVHLISNIPSSFTQNALFSSSCPGLGRGSMDKVILGGKSFSLSSQEINVKPESKTKVNVRPGQFDDVIEENKIMFQSLVEPIKDPLKQLYEERQLSSTQLKRERNNQQQRQRNNQLNLRIHKKEMERTGSNIDRRDKSEKERDVISQIKSRKNSKINRKRQLQQTDFVAQDINWSEFINSNANELDQITLENKEEEQKALQLELEGGDYDRYLSIPKSIQEKFNFDNDIANSLQIVIGQNPSYKLSEKKLVYETLFQNLNTLTQIPHKNKN
ncbi:hypothetical protein RhiirA5_400683 [Rhizophagus irregularis]|uniref:Uncharacterized protein n=2 Tax=Rhizophagus irregularis TaxID=588596 RepID=A0A2I1ETP8_9GLOM|nr:hypothetical protein GLOIN_2v1625060 [Rhizophagus irregularis DAOM 181602=DAOM 197198]PKC05871.1 hypothetical protein RhiirA5_400683 [Rhizophagus irregularis]PKC74150.1 hypothetical protein RhiirA1_437144 [Rhizophagus irregularis]PKY25516.1 hypothetical protein RhiirB3_511141 [Rhizophagus irregularis]POG69666.1 hypothetical protein GLOIN_2v1625060 [Rhizophagus irregularis DAOM 181602=DAOM 197198]|eukprot:XP_025176532.1 hypothetical protein GLOIN_2v1625060 [Rhizophagus irregularis DAOM 181602=DAOM 197198]